MKLLRLIVRAMASAGLRLESWSYAIDRKWKIGIWKNLTIRRREDAMAGQAENTEEI